MTTQSILGCLSEWAADLMTRYAHVGDLGQTAGQLIRTIRREDLVQTAKTIWSSSRKHGGHVLGWHLSGHETELSRRAHCDDELMKNNGTLNSQRPSKVNLDNLFLGSATTFLQQFRTEQEYAWKKISRMLVWHNRMNLLIHRKHEKFRCHQTDLSPKYVRIR